MMRGGDGTEERRMKPGVGRGGAGERIGGAPARGRVRGGGVAGRRGGGRGRGGVASGPSGPKRGSNAVEETIVSDCVCATCVLVNVHDSWRVGEPALWLLLYLIGKVCMYICVCDVGKVCMHLYVCICICMYIYIYVYI